MCARMFSMPSEMTSRRRGACKVSFSLLDPYAYNNSVSMGQKDAKDVCDDAALVRTSNGDEAALVRTSNGNGPDAIPKVSDRELTIVKMLLTWTSRCRGCQLR